MRLSEVHFTSPVRDPSAAGGFERMVFSPRLSPTVTIEREADGTITLSCPGGTVIVAGVPFWGVRAVIEPEVVAALDEPVTVVEKAPTTYPRERVGSLPQHRVKKKGDV